MSAAVRYEITGYDLNAHEFLLRMQVPGPLLEGQLLRLPAWIPGSYMIRDFCRNITSISAHDETGPVVLTKVDKQSWRVPACRGNLTIDYTVYAFDLSVRTAYLDRTRAYFNGTSLFFCLPGRLDGPWELTLQPLTQPEFASWRVATQLPLGKVDARGFGVYAGEGYECLIDCPTEIGAFDQAGFSIDGKPHTIVVTDGGRFDMPRICRDLSAICSEHAALFGELPVSRYLFLVLATADGYGGLEHSDSTSLICKRSDLPAAGLGKPDKGYRQFLGLCSHEYFHLWNVKRIRPARFAENDLSAEVHTELLWAFEGITSYYDELALVRSAVLAAEDYLDLFAGTVSRVLRSPGRARQSIAESSFDAWTKFYKQDENAPNAIVSYYTKGALVALGLDVTLREGSGDTLSLDDLMRLLWQRYGKHGKGVPERAIEHEAADLLGTSLDAFFQNYVYGTKELPLEEWFAKLGVGFRARRASGADDLGGYRSDPPSAELEPALDARFESQPGGLRLTHVIAGGAAQRAGLAPGDLLLALDGERLTAINLSDLLKRMAGGPAEIHYFRRDRMAVTELAPCEAPADTCDLWLLPTETLSGQVLARRNSWFRSNRTLMA